MMKQSIVVLLLSAFLSVCPGQTEMANSGTMDGPEFHIDYATLASPTDLTQVRLYLYFEIKNDGLQFVKLEDGYEANYEISIVLLDKDDYQVTGKITKKTLFVDEYDQTNSRVDFTLTQEFFDIEPGDYRISATLEDAETGRSRTMERKIKAQDFSRRDLSVSDIIFSDSLATAESGKKWISPTISDSRKGFNDRIYAYFELYNTTDTSQPVTIDYELIGNSTRFRFNSKYETSVNSSRHAEIIRIPADSLAADEYRLKVKIQGKNKIETEKTFFVRWLGLPATAKDIDAAIEQLQYIANSAEWKELKKSDGQERLEAFQKFWEKRDPTPGTDVNEAMEGHYNRVEYANRSFSVMQREGWRTDMGMVYIILGAPDEVERNVFPRFS
ncbi:GWxTD domain-containing protein, partial [candidate division KSB1 bacterium]|nr:GWxTD domain-containing protein [candidate division KSB1 bacterium]